MIEKIEETIIRGRVWSDALTPLSVHDILTGHGYCMTLIYYQRIPSISRMKWALAEALNIYPNFCASLVRRRGDIFFHHNGAGALFSVYKDTGSCPPVNEPVTDEYPMVGADAPFNYPIGSGVPPISFRLVLFSDEKCVLITRMAHSLADGATLGAFLYCWAAIYGNRNFQKPTEFQRSDLDRLGELGDRARKINVPQIAALMPVKTEKEEVYGAIHIEIPAHLIQEVVKKCKQRQIPLAKSLKNKIPVITSSDVIHALAWKAFAASSEMHNLDESRIYTAFDIRPIPGLNLPKDYEGNAVTMRSAKATYQEISGADTADLAELYHCQTKPIASTDVIEEISLLCHLRLSGHISDAGDFCKFYGDDFLNSESVLVNDLRFSKFPDITTVQSAVWFTVAVRGVNVVFVYQHNSNYVSFRYFGKKNLLNPFASCLNKICNSII